MPEPKDAGAVAEAVAKDQGASPVEDTEQAAFDQALEKQAGGDAAGAAATPPKTAPPSEPQPAKTDEGGGEPTNTEATGTGNPPPTDDTKARQAITDDRKATETYWETVIAAHPDAVQLAESNRVAEWARQQGGEMVKLLEDTENPASAIRLIAAFKGANPDHSKPAAPLADAEWAEKYLPGFAAKVKTGKADDGKTDIEMNCKEAMEAYPEIVAPVLTTMRSAVEAVMRSVPAIVEQRVQAILAQRDADAAAAAELEKSNQGAAQTIASDEFKSYLQANPYIARVWPAASPKDKADILAGFQAVAGSIKANAAVTAQRQQRDQKRQILSGTLPRVAGGAERPAAGAKNVADMSDDEAEAALDAAVASMGGGGA